MERFWQFLDSSWFGRFSVPKDGETVLRAAIGVLGMTLAPAVWFLGAAFGKVPLLPSVSDYYHTNSGDLFVGVLFLMGAFQISYRGHQRVDDLVTWLTGILALGIATFPCTPVESFVPASGRIGVFQLCLKTSGVLHLISAFSFFLVASFYILFFFRRGKAGPSQEKWRKNLVFLLCGSGMLAILAGLAVVFVIKGKPFFDHSGVLFFPECALLLFFGIAWLVKANVVPGLIDPPSSASYARHQLQAR